ncbi:MAG: ribonuclease J [Ruminococcaceae bacterium]|nr:ribonuclease J [Oscillospiraceae bacterium]
MAKEKIRTDKNVKLRIMSLGGLGEIGKNITVFEYGDDIVVIDAGLGFPDEDMLGVDLVIPDISYLVKNADKIRGILITHGHEDHIGAVPYVLKQINVPIYGTRLSLGIIEGKLDEINPGYEPDLYTVEAGDVINLGVFKAEFIHVNHSIADACAISLKTPVGTVFHSGDFKLDVSPIDGFMMDLTRIGEIGKAGVELLLCESTNAERAGYTPSERTVGSSLERIFAQYEDKRLIVATFSSNIHRVQQIINASANHGRKVAILGRSMVNVIGAAAELGYIDLPDETLIDIGEIKKYKPEQVTLITTGSQGEPMSALYRIAFSEHDRVRLTPGDVVILSSSAIPGNEKLVGKIVNALIKNGVKVVNDSIEDVHVSGHACREEIKLLMALLKPKYFMPIHGEERHLFANKENAEFMGILPQNIFISEIGRVLELDRKGAKFNGTVPAGRVLIDGSGIGDIGSIVLRDRKILSEDGLVVVVATFDSKGGYVVSGPDIVSRGFVYVKESEELMDEARRVAESALDRTVTKRFDDRMAAKAVIKDELAKFIFKKTKRRPMILPIIMEV